MKKFFKRALQFLVVVAFLALIGITSYLWKGAGGLISPPRRELQAYHKELISSAPEKALSLTRYDFLDGEVPSYIVRPLSGGAPGQRGQILRDQLEKRGVSLQEYGKEAGIVVLLHGHKSRKEDMLPIAERFASIGFICLLPDLPGHGESPRDKCSFGSSDFEKALPGKMIDEFCAKEKVFDLSQHLWGMSMGGSYAMHTAAYEPERWKSQIIVSSLDDLEDLIRSNTEAPYLIPFARQIGRMRGLDVHAVRPVDQAPLVKAPSLVIHGDVDYLIKLHRGKALFDALKSHKKFMTVPGGNHGNVLVTDAPVYATMGEWLLGA